MVLLSESGNNFGTYKVPISAPIVAVMSLWSGYTYGAAHSHPSSHPISAGLQGGRYIPTLVKPEPGILPLIKCLGEQEDLDMSL